MASLKTVRIVTTSTSTLYSLGTGTTSTSTGNTPAANKGVSLTVQNQSTGAFDIYLGDSTLAIAIGATSTSAGGLVISPGGSFTIAPRHAPSAIQLDEFFIASTSSQAICVAQLLKAV